MGYTTSTVHGIEVPDSAEANNVPEDIGKVVTALEAGSIVKRLTGAQISALTSPQKPAGLLVYNTTTATYQMSDGTNFTDVGPLPYAELRRTTNQNISTASWTKITYTASTDPKSIGNTGTGAITLAAGVWSLSFTGIWEIASTFDCGAALYVNSVMRALAPSTINSGWNPSVMHCATTVVTTSSVTAEVYGIHFGGTTKNLATAYLTAVRVA